MGMSEEILSSGVVALLAIPLGASIIVALLGNERGPLVRRIALIATLANLVIAVILVANFQTDAERLTHSDTFKPQMKTEWELLRLISPASMSTPAKLGSIAFYVGLDGLNIWLVALTTLLMVP